MAIDRVDGKMGNRFISTPPTPLINRRAFLKLAVPAGVTIAIAIFIQQRPQTNIISFGSAGNLNILNSAFKWNQGKSPSSKYIISQPNTLQIIANKETDHWEGNYSAPLMAYPIEGNFEASVKVLFDPMLEVQAAGLGVRSSQFTNTFVRIALSLDPNFSGKSLSIGKNVKGRGERLGGSIAYRDSSTWMRILRQNSYITFSYSKDNKIWVDMLVDYSFDLPAEAEIFLYAFSIYNNQNVVATFYDFSLTHPVQK